MLKINEERFRRFIRKARAAIRRADKTDMRGCAPCKKKLLERMKRPKLPRVLNAEVAFHCRTTPTARPQVADLDLYGRHVLFDANSLLAVEVPESAARYARERRAAPPQANGALWCHHQPQWPLIQSPPLKLVLNVTDRCNLACRYCWVRNAPPDDGKPPTMPIKTAIRALDLLKGRQINVSFFGGEPLLAWDVLEAVAEEARKRTPEGQPRPRLHVTTNATLITATMAAKIKQRGMSVLVSLDGPYKVHEVQRPWPGHNSYAATLGGLIALNSAGVRPYLRATFDDPDTDLAGLLEYFSEIVEAGLASGVSIEPAVLSEGCATGVLTAEGADTLARRYHDAAEWYVARARTGKVLDFAPFRKMIQRILYTRHAKSECGAGQGYMMIDADGSIHACHKGGCEIGHLDYGIDESRRAAWSDNRVYHQRKCMTCWARYLCGGGCRHHRLTLSGDVRGEAEAPCRIKKMLIREALWILAELGPERCKAFIR